jgi:hypothetical protein
MASTGACVLEIAAAGGRKIQMDAPYEITYSPDPADRRVKGYLRLGLQDGIKAQLAGRGELVLPGGLRPKVVFVCYAGGYLEFTNDGAFPAL